MKDGKLSALLALDVTVARHNQAGAARSPGLYTRLTVRRHSNRDSHRRVRAIHGRHLSAFLIRFHCRCPLSESSYRLLSSPVSLPFSAAHFLGPLLRANSCVLQLRGLCFPGSALNSIWVPSHKAAARFGSRSHS